jgi:hypothetical protein
MNERVDYRPRPLDTSGVRLDAALMALVEVLAENAHDAWAAERLAQGWRYGRQRDDARKLHPSLVPYADLPEAEKQIDRSMVLATVRAILALGYDMRRRDA